MNHDELFCLIDDEIGAPSSLYKDLAQWTYYHGNTFRIASLGVNKGTLELLAIGKNDNSQIEMSHLRPSRNLALAMIREFQARVYEAPWAKCEDSPP